MKIVIPHKMKKFIRTDCEKIKVDRSKDEVVIECVDNSDDTARPAYRLVGRSETGRRYTYYGVRVTLDPGVYVVEKKDGGKKIVLKRVEF